MGWLSDMVRRAGDAETLPTDAAETIRRHACYVPGSRVEWIGDRVVRIILPDGSSSDYLAPPRFYPDEHPLSTDDGSGPVHTDRPVSGDHRGASHADRDGSITDTNDATTDADTATRASGAGLRGMAGGRDGLHDTEAASVTISDCSDANPATVLDSQTERTHRTALRVDVVTDAERKQHTRRLSDA